jgi:hypothetical protein
VWFSLFTPQKGDQLPEMLEREERIRAISEMTELRKRFTKLDMPEGLIRQFASPPHRPEDCIFALTTETLPPILERRSHPAYSGATPTVNRVGA